MKLVAWIFGLAFLAGALMAGYVAVVNDDQSLGRIQLVSHEYGGGECWDESCRGGQDYDQWNNEDRNRNRNRNRGAFSPGPFDDSPVDAFNGNTICLPGSTCYTDDRRQGNEPPPEQGGPA